MITSLNNRGIKNIAELQSKARLRRAKDSFVIEGFKLFMEAPVNLIKEVYVRTDTLTELAESYSKAPLSLKGKVYERIVQLKEKGIICEEVASDVFKKISDTGTPQGITAVTGLLKTTLEDMLSSGGKRNILILEDIQDPGNLGTMIRTAEGAGFRGVIMTKGCADIYNPKTVRSTMGSLFRVPFLYEDDISVIIDKLKKNGFRLYAAHLEGSVSYENAFDENEAAIMIGNEANGLSDGLAVKSDIRVIIPMEGRLESLNASVAAALLMYEAKRRK